MSGVMSLNGLGGTNLHYDMSATCAGVSGNVQLTVVCLQTVHLVAGHLVEWQPGIKGTRYARN